jgi:lipopolysaccharide assembly outer membrane protein LptD (OstA)
MVSAGSSTAAEFTLQLGQLPGGQGPLRPYPSPSNPNIRADRQTRQGPTVQYRGNVVMTTNGLELRADELDYDTNNGMGDVRGNVKFRVQPSTARVIPLSN